MSTSNDDEDLSPPRVIGSINPNHVEEIDGDTMEIMNNFFFF